MINKYKHCTVIDGNLLLLQCHGRDFDFSALQSIEMITGYLYVGEDTVKILEIFLKYLEIF